MQMFSAYTTSSLFLNVGELGIPDLLAEGPLSVDQLARRARLDPDALYRVMRMLASNGVFSEVSPRTFKQTAASDALRMFRARRIYLHVPAMLRTGRSAFDLAFGVCAWEYFDRHPTESALFNRAQAMLIGNASDAIASGYNWLDATRVMDVGGGTGALISAILRANPHLSGVLVERRAVVAEAREAIAERGLAARCEVMEGDFMHSVPSVKADVVLLSHIIHDWSDEQALTILTNARSAMRPGDRLVLAEALLPPGDTPHPSKRTDISMLVWCEGRERTLEEYRDLLGRAGLQFNRVLELPATPLGTSLIEAVAVDS
jgi:SAM-dependent methyltransferase